MEYGSVNFELSLDDFNDEDLSDIIIDEDSKLHCYVNDNFKVTKRRSQKKKKVSNDASHAPKRPRPQTLRFFAAPLRPGPLPPKIPERVIPQVEDVELKQTHCDVTNNNTINNTKNSDCNQTSEKTKHIREESTKPRFRRSIAVCTKSNTSEDIVNLTSVREQRRHRCPGLTRSASEWSIEDPDKIEYCYMDGELKEQTHSALFKFVPRHKDEIQLEINDPLCVENQADDFWFEGINMRTGERGAFPAYYAQGVGEGCDDVSEFSVREENCEKFHLYFLGSVEVSSHKGNEVLCQAMHEVAQSRRHTLHTSPPAYVCLLVNHHGIKMMDQSLMKKRSTSSCDVNKTFSSSSKVRERIHFFQLRNVSFCGHHPKNDKYFAFITRHPDAPSRFACHTFVSEASTRPLAESVGRAFATFYQEFLECQHPIEDIYIE
uniref:C-Jun-amino-terminal kinase-interacting protein 1 n=1 Tax=Ciona intestinalis TaxID=7719 RepID=H2XVM6_CIOIN|nr:C-Jun-amino-terminal kinase-interacting protein 1 isoform X2 [Ciona intestinalis]|eukprot:XP_002128105.1 C-Jun-amino-terminal kinase-interacting protein 1 isoform X2 [Ciona intestinalis]